VTAVAAAGPLVLVAGTPASAHAAPAIGHHWTTAAPIPSAVSNDGPPAFAEYDGLLYAAWQGQSSPYSIWYATYNGTSWSAETTVPRALTNYISGPALAVFEGDLYVVWKGQSGPFHLYYSVFNGSQWTTTGAEIPHALTTGYSTPGLAGYDGRLYVSWAGQTGTGLWYTSFDGTTWASQSTVPSAVVGFFQGVDTPLAAYGGDLYTSWEDASEKLMYSSFDGTTWSTPSSVGTKSEAGPALAVTGGDLYEAWTSYANLDIEVSYFNGTTWTPRKAVPGAGVDIQTGPGVGSFGGATYVGWDSTFPPTPVDYAVGS
jgi:hypothetical protein